MEQALVRTWAATARVLRNHGALVVGETVAEAFVLHHFLELAAQAQVGALAGGGDIVVPSRCDLPPGRRDMASMEAARTAARTGAHACAWPNACSGFRYMTGDARRDRIVSCPSAVIVRVSGRSSKHRS